MEPNYYHILRDAAELDDLQIAEALWLSRFAPRFGSIPAENGAEAARSSDPQSVPPPRPPAPLPQAAVPESSGEPESKPLFASDGAGNASEGGAVPVSRVRAPGVSALPAALLISRALRPFARRIDSDRVETLDEPATVNLSAELSRKEAPILMPVMKPAKERWFEIALVVEDVPSMAVWRSTVRELARLLENNGSFRDVRLWHLAFEGGAPRLTSAGAACEPRGLNDASSRRLLMLVSDCVSPEWRNGQIARLIEGWSASMPVVIGQMLSRRIWRRTALGEPTAAVKTPRPGAINQELRLTDLKWWDRIGTEDAADPPSDPRFPCPVISLDPKLISQWAAMLMRPGRRCDAVLLSPEPRPVPGNPSATAPSPESRIERFRMMVSPEAFDLAVKLSLMPLALPVMRVVHRATNPDARQEQLAELLLGGLLKRKDPNAPPRDHEHIQYEFHDGVRELLRSELRPEEILPILQAVSDFIGRRIHSVHDFIAWAQDAEGAEHAEADALPFAQLGLDGLEHLGYPRRTLRSIVAVPGEIVTAAAAPAERSTNDDSLEMLLRIAEQSAASGDARGAEVLLERATQIYPREAAAWMRLADHLKRQDLLLRSSQSLLNGLRHDDEVVRAHVVNALASFNALLRPEEIEELQQILVRDLSPDVRRIAANALARIRNQKVEAALRDRLSQDEDEFVRLACGQALLEGRGDNTEALVDAFIALLNDSSAANRRFAVRALEELGDSRAIPALQDAALDSVKAVREVAEAALESLGAHLPEVDVQMSTALAPLSVFISYSRQDEPLMDQLAEHLSILQQQGLIEVWSDRNLRPGYEWREIDLRLKEADLILLLVSADYLSSDVISVEITRAMERHLAGEAVVVPIILRPCYWGETPFSKLQALPQVGRPITKWENRDEAFENITIGLRRIIEQILAKRRRQAAASPRTDTLFRGVLAALYDSGQESRALALINIATEMAAAQRISDSKVVFDEAARIVALKGRRFWQAKSPMERRVEEARKSAGVDRASGDRSWPGIFLFDHVTLDSSGNKVHHQRWAARQFVEELAPGVSLDMVEIPGGTFKMGTSDEEAEKVIAERVRHGASKEDVEKWTNWERPQHEVTVPPFFIGKFTITQAQWRVVAGWEKVEIDLKPAPSGFKGDDRPVENVNWHDVKEFCARLSAKTGRQYRLPSEAEWEYACRAGTTTPFAFGETITPEIVNYEGNYPYAKAKKGKDRSETIPVGSLGVANAFGLYDMHGNVWEWCEDGFVDNYEGAPIDGSARLSKGDSSRVLRGGSCFYYAVYCRAAARLWLVARHHYPYCGVRVVVSARTL